MDECTLSMFWTKYAFHNSNHDCLVQCAMSGALVCLYMWLRLLDYVLYTSNWSQETVILNNTSKLATSIFPVYCEVTTNHVLLDAIIRKREAKSSSRVVLGSSRNRPVLKLFWTEHIILTSNIPTQNNKK